MLTDRTPEQVGIGIISSDNLRPGFCFPQLRCISVDLLLCDFDLGYTISVLISIAANAGFHCHHCHIESSLYSLQLEGVTCFRCLHG
jgi:hypothetical protein